MAETRPEIEGTIAGKPLSPDAKHKIQEVLKTTLEHELANVHTTVGAAAARPHGSVTHGSVTKAL